MFHLIVLAFIFFRVKNITDAFYILRHLYPENITSYFQFSKFFALFNQLGLGVYQFSLAIIAIILLELIEFLMRGRIPMVTTLLAKRPIRWAFYYLIIFVIIF